MIHCFILVARYMILVLLISIFIFILDFYVEMKWEFSSWGKISKN